jgi:hypothetical protein
MPDKPAPTYLDRLRIVRAYLTHQLDQVDRWIADEERKAAEKKRGEERRPPAPDWVFQMGLNPDNPPVAVHVGGCHMAGQRVRGVARDQALRALAEGVAPCTHCRPDSELGYLEG